MASMTPSATPMVDQTYGQRSVFGGDGFSTAPVDADIDCEDEQEALAYLQLVRNEASKIPHVMVARRHGPQALPPGYAAAAAAVAAAARQVPQAKKKRQRRRHWDEQDDGVEAAGTARSDANAAKKRRVSRQQAVAVELSYDDEGASGRLSYDDDPQDDYEPREAPEDEDNDDDVDETDNENVNDNDAHEPDYSLDHRDLYESSVGDARGYYQDGAYVAAPAPDEDGLAAAQAAAVQQRDVVHTNDPEAESAQFRTAYRSRLLLTHFAQMRSIFHPATPIDPNVLAAAVAALPPDHDTDVGPLSTRSGAFRRWLFLLRTTDPLPAQIAAMDKVSVLRVLRILLQGLLAGGSTSSRSSRGARFARALAGAGGPGKAGGNGGLDMTGRTSRWLWALFARLPDRGELDYRDVGYIRDVAKQAVMRLAYLSYDMAGTDVHGRVEEDGAGEEDGAAVADQGEPSIPVNGETDEVAHANGDEDAADLDHVLMDMDSEAEDGREDGNAKDTGAPGMAHGEEAQNDEEEDEDEEDEEDGEMHQRATLEMVLAVAGEFYGQRDLLAFRTPW